MDKYKKDPNKKYRYDWNNLKVGDYVFTSCNGLCPGGLEYGIGEIVTNIIAGTIYTRDSYGKTKWDMQTKRSVNPPRSYYLAAFQSN